MFCVQQTTLVCVLCRNGFSLTRLLYSLLKLYSLHETTAPLNYHQRLSIHKGKVKKFVQAHAFLEKTVRAFLKIPIRMVMHAARQSACFTKSALNRAQRRCAAEVPVGLSAMGRAQMLQNRPRNHLKFVQIWYKMKYRMVLLQMLVLN